MTNKKALVQSLHTKMTTTRDKTTGKSTTKHTLIKDGKLTLWIKIAED